MFFLLYIGLNLIKTLSALWNKRFKFKIRLQSLLTAFCGQLRGIFTEAIIAASSGGSFLGSAQKSALPRIIGRGGLLTVYFN